jgi:hypothetical protein
MGKGTKNSKRAGVDKSCELAARQIEDANNPFYAVIWLFS